MKIYLDIRPNRIKNGWSLRDLENHSGVPRSTLSDYENGVEPSITNYVKIAKAFKIPFIENDLLKILND